MNAMKILQERTSGLDTWGEKVYKDLDTAWLEFNAIADGYEDAGNIVSFLQSEQCDDVLYQYYDIEIILKERYVAAIRIFITEDLNATWLQMA